MLIRDGALDFVGLTEHGHAYRDHVVDHRGVIVGSQHPDKGVSSVLADDDRPTLFVDQNVLDKLHSLLTPLCARWHNICQVEGEGQWTDLVQLTVLAEPSGTRDRYYLGLKVKSNGKG